MTSKTLAISTEKKYEYCKMMIEDGYTVKQIQDLSGASNSTIVRWKRQYKDELLGKTPATSAAFTPEQQEIQTLKKQLKRAQRDNDILKKAAALLIQDNNDFCR